jgi:hypothetical protein
MSKLFHGSDKSIQFNSNTFTDTDLTTQQFNMQLYSKCSKHLKGRVYRWCRIKDTVVQYI